MAKSRQQKKQRQKQRQLPARDHGIQPDALVEEELDQPKESIAEEFSPQKPKREKKPSKSIKPAEPVETEPEIVDYAKEPKKKEKKDSEEKVGLFKTFGRFLKASWAELHKVVWPTKPQLVRLTFIVIGFVFLIGAYLGLLDYIFSKLIQDILLG